MSRLSFASFRLSDIESGTEDIAGLGRPIPDERDANTVMDKNHGKVKVAKRILFVVLLASATIVSYLTYHFTSQNAKKMYEKTVEALGTLVVEAIDRSLNDMFLMGERLAISYTFLNASWPNVTLTAFQDLTASLEDISVSFLPYLDDYDSRKEWEQYAAESDDAVLVEEQMDVINQYSKNLTKRRLLPIQQRQEQKLTDIKRSLQSPNRTIADGMYALQDGESIDDITSPPYWPVWQISHLEQNKNKIMYNQYSNWFGKPAVALRALLALTEPVLSQILYEDLDVQDGIRDVPRLYLYYPILNFDGRLVGTISVAFDIASLFRGSLPQTSSDSLDVLISNSCGQLFSFRCEGPDALFVAVGNVRNLPADTIHVERTWSQSQATCIYKTEVFPSDQVREEYMGNSATVYTSVVASVFVFISLAFLIYARVVEYQQAQLVQQATQTSAIVRSLFPANVRERLFREAATDRKQGSRDSNRNRSILNVPHTPKIRLKNFLADYSNAEDGTGDDDGITSEPNADLFPHTTVIFADIAGFTAWSSEREPSQVFKLLESLYRKFDAVAHKLGVFKVETIGDCYVAVVGLPDPVPDHAVVCARFAFEILYHMHELTTQLEGSLGPGTSDLTLRIGLHSGPVTAGVLRGEKSRFQLFGDTINTASRIESCGLPDRVHCSEHTATLLEAAGKGHWLTQREGLVAAKGKGEMQTFWLKPRRGNTSTHESTEKVDAVERIDEYPLQNHNGKSHRGCGISLTAGATGHRWEVMQFDSISEPTTASDIEHTAIVLPGKKIRLIKWHVDVLMPLLVKIITRRKGYRSPASSNPDFQSPSSSPFRILEEVTEIIKFPDYDPNVSITDSPSHTLVLDDCVKRLLRDYVTRVATLYRDNPFHNFEHASHVTMSANKLLKRIIHPDDLDYNMEGAENKEAKIQSLTKELHWSTYGISSDPLTQFAIVFSALIHDLDHTGLPNDQLVQENAEVAKRFHNKSVAEQNSLYLAWEILMEPQYESLRSCIWTTEAEKRRFRQLLVNSVMATDILDKEQQTIRKRRWEKAFCEESEKEDHLDVNRKATAVLEHIIQASDVAHTMQHWRIYRKWNERYFREKYCAWKHGHAENDPSLGWYEGEIWFFDNYIIPLARKLKESGVFGVSSDEYLQYALENRQEWECKGRQVCEEMLENASFEWEAADKESYALDASNGNPSHSRGYSG